MPSVYELEVSDVDVAEVDPDELELLEPDELERVLVVADESEVVEAHPAKAPTSDRPTAATSAVFFRGMRFMSSSIGKLSWQFL